MGVDDEYKMVSAQDDVNDHLLERTVPITRAAYKKRNMFASIAIGALIGAAVTFLFSFVFAPKGYTVQKADTPAAAQQVAVTTTVTSVAPAATVTVSAAAAAGSTVGSVGQGTADALHTLDYSKGLIQDCGRTPSEARANDCIFDVMMQDWMPRACHDEALSERYLATGNWTWWVDAEATKSLTLEEMRKGEHTVIYVIQDYHRSHCIYAWEKFVRALRNDWPVIEELISYDHVMHCRHSTLSKESAEIRGVRAPTAYTRCARYSDWQGHFPANSVSSIDKRYLLDASPF